MVDMASLRCPTVAMFRCFCKKTARSEKSVRGAPTLPGKALQFGREDSRAPEIGFHRKVGQFNAGF